jgi:hypothetical protein
MGNVIVPTLNIGHGYVAAGRWMPDIKRRAPHQRRLLFQLQHVMWLPRHPVPSSGI